MTKRFGVLPYVFSFAMLAIFAHDAVGATRQKHASTGKDAGHATPPRHEQASAKSKGSKRARRTNEKGGKLQVGDSGRTSQIPIPLPKPAPPPAGDLGALKQALELVRMGKTSEATAVKNMLDDEVAQKLIEWFVLRHPNGAASFRRYAAFIDENPNWPSMRQLRRRAEERLWQEKIDAATVHRFTADQPVSGAGRLALARALLNEGDRGGAAREAREAWRSQELSERIEGEAFEALPRSAHARGSSGADGQAHRRQGPDGSKPCGSPGRQRRQRHHQGLCGRRRQRQEGARPARRRVGRARQDLGFVLCRVQWLMRQNRIADATRVILEARPDTMALQETDQWWRERRVLARKLLDQKEYQSAYEMVSKAAPPASETYRAEMYFMAGWIALRYLDDPATARAHFAHIDEGSTNPIVLARGNYWRGRAAEAAGDSDAMRAGYEAAARYPTAYYGQLARAKLGMDVIALRQPPRPDPCYQPRAGRKARARRRDALCDRRARRRPLLRGDLAEQSNDVALSALGELTARHNDAPAMLQLGKTALARGLPLDLYAFPDIGIPLHNQIAPAIETSMIYSVARTESAFDQRDTSPAKAVGLMQVTPEAGRDTAKRFGVTYDWNKLVSDPVYNTQMGAAELSALLREYRGSHIMTFAGYNAGRGRVQEWIKAHGDPRDPKVDAVDWVERIPFAETRNYVQRVMENLQVYRVRFNVTTPSRYLNLLQGAEETNPDPVTSVTASGLP